MAGELDQNGSLTKSYGWKPNSIWTTDPVFMREGESYYYYNDHLGTPQKLTTQNGQVVWQAKYTAFGEAVIDPASTITNNLRFPGQYQDEETGLHYNYHRYYEPRSGRYLTPDPIGLEGGVNLYGYVENSPVNNIDPYGLTLMSISWFFHDWVHGTGENSRTYGPGSTEVQEMQSSPGADHMREAFKKNNCNTKKDEFSTWQGIIHTAWRFRSTSFQVGGFMYAATNNGNGTVTYTINNTASARSFFYHLPFIPNRDRGEWVLDNFSNIYQTFQWTEKSPCCEGGK